VARVRPRHGDLIGALRRQRVRHRVGAVPAVLHARGARLAAAHRRLEAVAAAGARVAERVARLPRGARASRVRLGLVRLAFHRFMPATNEIKVLRWYAKGT